MNGTSLPFNLMENQIFFRPLKKERERETEREREGGDLREQHLGRKKNARIRFIVAVMLLMENARMIPSNSIAGINNRRKACVTGFCTAICII